MNKNVFITILLIIVLCLGGYLVFDKISNQGSGNDISLTDKKDSNNGFNTNKPQNEDSSKDKNDLTVPQVLNFYDGVAIVSNGEVHVSLPSSIIFLDNVYGEGSTQTLLSTKGKYQEYSFNNVKYIDDSNENFKGMKLNVSGVKSVYSNLHGQALGADAGLLILKNDGTIYGISLYSLINGKTNVTQISSLNNIVNIVSKQNGGVTTYAVDKDGNEFNMKDYVPSNHNEW